MNKYRKSVKNTFPITPSEWKKRRLRLDLCLISIFCWLSYIIFSNSDTVLFQQISIALIAAAVSLLGTYIFGAVFDDKHYMNAINVSNQQSNQFGPVDDSQIPTDDSRNE
jgi:hypothetical protein